MQFVKGPVHRFDNDMTHIFNVCLRHSESSLLWLLQDRTYIRVPPLCQMWRNDKINNCDAALSYPKGQTHGSILRSKVTALLNYDMREKKASIHEIDLKDCCFDLISRVLRLNSSRKFIVALKSLSEDSTVLFSNIILGCFAAPTWTWDRIRWHLITGNFNINNCLPSKVITQVRIVGRDRKYSSLFLPSSVTWQS